MKYLVMLLTALAFSGCTSDNPSDCKMLGYKGIVVTDGVIGYDHCSNGEIVETNKYLTSDGTKWVCAYSYLSFDNNNTKLRKRK